VNQTEFVTQTDYPSGRLADHAEVQIRIVL